MEGTLKPIATIVVIEDDIELLELEKFHLEKEGFKVLDFISTKNVESILKQDIDLMIVDRKLPGIEGSDFIRYIRDKGIQIPVIFVSAKDRDSEIEEGFLSGGDDYLRKPFNTNELIFRVKAILKRTNALQHERLIHRDIVMDLNSRKTYIQESEVALTKLEFNLLSFFIKNKNRILERDYLLRYVWNDSELKQKRTVNVTINRLKKKIDPENNKEYINPIHGIGYKLI
ncbi:MAG TPA: response regulator transcription factor [Campylobacterales bacterium]|nr:response regulator transcription factor [Campylobacterales bacterium]